MLRRTTSIRVGLTLVGAVALITGPWWLLALVIILLSMRFAAWESILLGLAADLLWLPSGGMFGALPLFTIGAIVLVWALEPIRRQFLLS